MSIFPWPVFNDTAFYTMFKQLKIKLDDAPNSFPNSSKYNNARAFVEKIKV